MRAFLILFGPRACPRLRLDVMATDSFAAADQHVCLALEGERMEVIAA